MTPCVTLLTFIVSTLMTGDNFEINKTRKPTLQTQKVFSDTEGLGNTKKAVFVTTIDKGDYFYIPPSASSDSVDAILYQDKTRLKVNPDNRPIKFSWTSNCNDGEYILTITPEQIFFSSGHDNPNPNFLFWIVDITKEQFQAINLGVRKKPPKYFYDRTAPRHDSLFQDESEYDYYQTNFRDPCLIPKEWNDTNEYRFAACCEASIKKQLKHFTEILNSYMINRETLKLPDGQESLPKFGKYFSTSREEIYDWLPTKINQ